MSQNHSHQRINLASLSDQVLLDRRLHPYFSKAALKQLELINDPALGLSPAIKDLSSLLWSLVLRKKVLG